MNWDQQFIDWGLEGYWLDQCRWSTLFSNVGGIEWFHDRSVLLVSNDTDLLKRMLHVAQSKVLGCRKVIGSTSISIPDCDNGQYDCVILWDAWTACVNARSSVINARVLTKHILCVEGFVDNTVSIDLVSNYCGQPILPSFPGHDQCFKKGERAIWILEIRPSKPNKKSKIPKKIQKSA